MVSNRESRERKPLVAAPLDQDGSLTHTSMLYLRSQFAPAWQEHARARRAQGA